jgi:DNA-binding NarL/FixJ family response regulator
MMKYAVKTDSISLTVVDNHPVVFLGIQQVLTKIKDIRFDLNSQYLNGAEVVDNLINIVSDVVIIDMCLPDIKGYDLAKIILEVHPTIKIGIFSSVLNREYVLNSYKTGVLGFLPKTSSSEEICDFIITISKGERYLRGKVADIILENESYIKKQQNLYITKRESQILQLIFDGHKNREIAELLSIAERTVEFHKQNIYIKLDVTNSVDLYKAVLRMNLMSLNNTFQ